VDQKANRKSLLHAVRSAWHALKVAWNAEELRFFSLAWRYGPGLLLLALTCTVCVGSTERALGELFVFKGEPPWMLLVFAVQVIAAVVLAFLIGVRSSVVPVSDTFIAPRHQQLLKSPKARYWLWGALVVLLLAPWAFDGGEFPRVPEQTLEEIADGAELYASAKKGNPAAADQLGNYLLDKHQDRAALKLFRLAAKEGSADGQYDLATLRLYGRGGLKADETEATEWYAQAIRLRNPPAPTVAESVPAVRRDAQLRLTVRDPGPTKSTSCGDCSLRYPVWSGSGHDRHFHYAETRLMAIREDGFEVLLTKAEEQMVKKATVFFPFGKITQTKALGWEVTGEFK